MTSPYAFTDEELKMMDKDYKKPKVKLLFCKSNFSAVFDFRPRNGLFQRRKLLLQKTLFMKEELLQQGTSRECLQKLQIFCKMTRFVFVFD